MMNQDNTFSRYGGITCASFLCAIYFSLVSGLSNCGSADKNMFFYIGGCAVYFIIYVIAEKIFVSKIIISVKSAWYIFLTICGMLCVWVLYSYVKDPELFPVGIQPIHQFPVIWHFMILLGLVKLGSTIIDLDMESRNKTIRGAITEIAVIIQTLLLYAPNVFEDSGGGYYHIHAYVNSIINTLSSQPFDESNASVYGHYALIYVIPVKILHAVLGISNLTCIVLLICLVGAITYIFSYYLLDKLIRSNTVYCIIVIAYTAISTFGYGAGQYYQILPHRMLFQVCALYGAWYTIYVKRKKVLLWIICTCAVIWNIEVGLICCIASFLLNIWLDIDKDTKITKLSNLKNFILLILEVVCAYMVVNIYNVCNGGMWNSIKTFIFPIANSKYMLNVLPSALPDIFAGYYLEIMLFMGVLCYCGSKLICSKYEEDFNKNKYVFLIYNSLMGLGCLTYYMNRAARANIYISHVELIIVLAVCADLKTDRIKFGYSNFSKNHIKRSVELFSIFVLMSLVLDSVGNVGVALQSRVQTTWNTNTLDKLCKEIEETVPEGIYGYGYGVPELYSAMGRETGIYVGDWSDYGLFDLSKIDNQMVESDIFFANKSSFEMSRYYVDFVCDKLYEINGVILGLYVRNNLQPIDGNYVISPKQDSKLNITTDGSTIFLGNDNWAVVLDDHALMFDNDKILDVPNGVVDEAGRLHVWERNDVDAQRWRIEELNGYYLISWHDYALTYDLNDNTIRLMPKAGGDNQLWLFKSLK